MPMKVLKKLLTVLPLGLGMMEKQAPLVFALYFLVLFDFLP